MMRRRLLEVVKKIMLNNLIANIPVYPGYINSDGNVIPPSGTKEVHTEDYIPVTNTHLIFIDKYNTNISNWISVACYDENKQFITRPLFSSAQFNGDNCCYWVGTVDINVNTRFVKFSWRSHETESDIIKMYINYNDDTFNIIPFY